jgi:hypothetical protein
MAEFLEQRLLLTYVPLASPINVGGLAVGTQQVGSSRTMAVDGKGDYRVVWIDGGVKTRLFTPSGAPFSAPVSVDLSTLDSQATIAMDTAGDFVVAWTKGSDVFVERFNPKGASSALANSFGSEVILKVSSGSAAQPSVAMDSKGDYVLAYAAVTPVGHLNTLEAMLNNPTGGAGTFTTLAPSGVGNCDEPSVAMNAAGSFVIAYQTGEGSKDNEIAAQTFTAAGKTIATTAVTTGDLTDGQPSVGINSDGNFVATYTHVVSATPIYSGNLLSYTRYQTQVRYYRSYSHVKNVSPNVTLAGSSSEKGSAYEPCISVDENGDFAIAYTVGGNYFGADPNAGSPTVLAGAFSKAGVKLQSGIAITAPSPKIYNFQPSVVVTDDGHLFAAWENLGNLTSSEALPSDGVFTQPFYNNAFTYTVSGPTTTIIGGINTTYAVKITRNAGFTGAVTLAVANLPAGVTDTISADKPGASELRTITFVTSDAISSTTSKISTFNTTLKIGSGGVTLTPALKFNLFTSFISGWDSGQGVGSLVFKGSPLQINGQGFVTGSVVQFGGAGTNNPSLQAPLDLATSTVTVPLTAAAGPITIYRPGGLPIVSKTSVQYSAGSITNIFPLFVSAPQSLKVGTLVTISGTGFRQGDMVQFGDPSDITDTSVWATPVTLSSQSITVNVPRYALSGSISVIHANPSTSNPPIVSTQSVTVSNYRNTYGFNFENTSSVIDFEVSLQEMQNEFGHNQIDITIPTPFGTIDTDIPTPESLIFEGICLVALNGNGCCFGMALASELMQKDPSLIADVGGVPAGKANTVYNLPTGGALFAMLDQDHLAQWSTQVLNEAIDWETTAHSSASIYNQIHGLLAGGDHPLISLQQGGGHVVVAYDLEGTPSDFYIDVYDPNEPYNDAAEDMGEATSASLHQSTEMDHRIHVMSNNAWTYTRPGGEVWNGKYDSIIVMPTGNLTGTPTFPLSFTGLGNLIFGSSAKAAVAKILQTAASPDAVTGSNSSSVTAGATPQASTPAFSMTAQNRSISVQSFGAAKIPLQTMTGTSDTPFNANISKQATVAALGETVNVSAAQNSTITPTGTGINATATGSVGGSGTFAGMVSLDGLPVSDNVFTVTFQVGVPSTFNAMVSTSFLGSLSSADVQLFEVGTGKIFEAESSAKVTGMSSINQTGLLKPGTYILQSTLLGAAVSGKDSAAFSLKFSASPFTVNNTSDSGPGSLRQVITIANAASGPVTILFNIPKTDPGYSNGVFTIKPLSALPVLTHAGITLSGASQQTFTGKTNGTLPVIVLNGTSAGASANGLSITASGIIVNDIIVDDFTGASAAGIVLTGTGATKDSVTNSLIGVGPSGAAAPNALGVLIQKGANHDTIGGAGAGDVISGNTGDGIDLTGTGTSSNTIIGNKIGTNVAGTAAVPNDGQGILIFGAATKNTIGSAGDGNVISGNLSVGIAFSGTGTTGNTVEANLIGLNAADTAAIPNEYGIESDSGPTANTIGLPSAGNTISGNSAGGIVISGNGFVIEGNFIGVNSGGTMAIPNIGDGVFITGTGNYIGEPSSGNIISGNTRNGVELTGTGTSGNFVLTNYIGIGVNGAIPNGQSGISVNGGANGNTIGGTSVDTRNIISGNSNGILLSGVSGTVVTGNWIGLDSSGNSAVANQVDGVQLDNAATDNIIGKAGEGNVISGNTANGIEISGAASTGNSIAANEIGTNYNGSFAVANGLNGVALTSGATGNTVGGIGTGVGNVIAFNGTAGVLVTGTDDAILGNSIYSNGALGIDLGGNGVIPNDSKGHVGANNFQNFPVLQSAFGATVSGTLQSTANSTFRVEFFYSPTPDPTGFGEGQTFLGSLNVTTNDIGKMSFTFVAASGIPAGYYVTATVTDGSGNTSEFSQAIQVTNIT